jgi:bifunctional non-homologous end joining protein LigD
VPRQTKATFIEPMLLQPSETLPEGPGWTYELKLDGYRALAIKTGGLVRLRSRNDKDFNGKYPVIAKALGALPDETVVDGEVVALDPDEADVQKDILLSRTNGIDAVLTALTVLMRS